MWPWHFIAVAAAASVRNAGARGSLRQAFHGTAWTAACLVLTGSLGLGQRRGLQGLATSGTVPHVKDMLLAFFPTSPYCAFKDNFNRYHHGPNHHQAAKAPSATPATTTTTTTTIIIATAITLIVGVFVAVLIIIVIIVCPPCVEPARRVQSD